MAAGAFTWSTRDSPLAQPHLSQEQGGWGTRKVPGAQEGLSQAPQGSRGDIWGVVSENAIGLLSRELSNTV